MVPRSKLVAWTFATKESGGSSGTTARTALLSVSGKPLGSIRTVGDSLSIFTSIKLEGESFTSLHFTVTVQLQLHGRSIIYLTEMAW